MSEQSLPIVIVGAHTVGLGVIRALKNCGAPLLSVYYDPKDMGSVSRYPHQRRVSPHPEHQEAEFIHFLLDLASEIGESLLIPASDASLAAVSRHKSQLQSSFLVACTEWPITELFIDKKRTYALAEIAGVPAPRTLVPHTVAEVKAYGQTVDFPCLVKPCQSHQYFDIFHTKMMRVENLPQMITAYQQAADQGLEVLLQEIIPGEAACGANYNAYFWDGAPLVEFTARKVRNAPPDFGSPCVVMQQAVPEIIAPGRKMLAQMGFYGYACTEFKRDPRDGVYKLMEVNGRHNLSSLLSVRCGINFPVLQYRHLVLGELPQVNLSIDSGDQVYWIDLTRDCYYHLGTSLRSRANFASFIRPYRQKHIFAILDFHDLRPFIKRCAELLRDVMPRWQRS